MRTLRLSIVVIAIAALAGCATSELDAWLQTPAVQTEISTLEGFAFTLLNDWLETHVLATDADGNPDWSQAETTVIPQVEAKYKLDAVKATYVVRQAEARFETGLKHHKHKHHHHHPSPSPSPSPSATPS
jgi:hypothetical protein